MILRFSHIAQALFSRRYSAAWAFESEKNVASSRPVVMIFILASLVFEEVRSLVKIKDTQTAARIQRIDNDKTVFVTAQINSRSVMAFCMVSFA